MLLATGLPPQARLGYITSHSLRAAALLSRFEEEHRCAAHVTLEGGFKLMTPAFEPTASMH